MNFLKKYENFSQINFWLVKTSTPEFEIGLNKIGCSEKQKFSLLNNQIIKRKWKRIYVPIGLSNPTIYSHTRIGFEIDGYNYKGGVKITPDEIENWKTIITYNI